jgi:hypothetical protein
MDEPSVSWYRLQKDQQMLKEVVDFLLICSKFSTPTCFGIFSPSSGGRECLIATQVMFCKNVSNKNVGNKNEQ